MYVCLWSGAGAIPQNTYRLLVQLAGIMVYAENKNEGSSRRNYDDGEDQSQEIMIKKNAELKRTLGVFGASSLCIGAIIGAGIFVLIGVASGIAGPAIVLSFLIAGIILSSRVAKAQTA